MVRYMCVGGLYARHQESPFPVLEWLARNEHWRDLARKDREKCEGTFCDPSTESGEVGAQYCETCRERISWGEKVHYRTAITDHQEDTTIHCAKSCPACRKRARVQKTA